MHFKWMSPSPKNHKVDNEIEDDQVRSQLAICPCFPEPRVGDVGGPDPVERLTRVGPFSSG